MLGEASVFGATNHTLSNPVDDLDRAERELREADIVAEAGGVAAAATLDAAAGDGPDVTAASDSDAATGAASNPPNRRVCYLWGGLTEL